MAASETVETAAAQEHRVAAAPRDVAAAGEGGREPEIHHCIQESKT